MPDLDTTQTFAPGDTVTDVKLNNIIDQAVIQAAFITAKTPLGTVEPAEDYILILEGDSGLLKKVLVANVPGVASVGLSCAIPGTSVTNVTPSGPAVSIAIGNLSQTPNKFMASPDGASGLSVYRKLASRDMATPVHVIPAWDIDWSVSTTHYKTISAAGSFTFNNAGPGLAVDGQSILVMLGQTASLNPGWPAGIRWENGTTPVLTTGNGRQDMFQFWYLGGSVYGKRILTNAF